MLPELPMLETFDFPDCDDVYRYSGREAFAGSTAANLLEEARAWYTDVERAEAAGKWADPELAFNGSMAYNDAARKGSWRVGEGGDCDGDAADPWVGGEVPWTECDDDGRSCGHGVGTWCGEDCPECPSSEFKEIPIDDQDCDGARFVLRPCDDGAEGFVVYDCDGDRNLGDDEGEIVYITREAAEAALAHAIATGGEALRMDIDRPCEEATMADPEGA